MSAIEYKKIVVSSFSEVPQEGAYEVTYEFSGNIAWVVNGKLHRENAPAFAYKHHTSRVSWYRNDMLHREFGPAVETEEGSRYYLYGVLYEDVKDYWRKMFELGKIDEVRLLTELLK